MPSDVAIAVAPKKKTVSVCISVYRESNPMMDGVRMRLSVTVWNTTVPMPCANAATSMAPRTVSRRGR